MKKITKLLSGTLLTAAITLPTSAQQLPNADFEGNWVDCVPWNGGYNTTIKVGQNPENWCISHVMGLTKKFIFAAAGTGKKEMGTKSAGYESASAVVLKNDETGMTIGSTKIMRNVPGYLTCGTTWSTAQGTTKSTHDGGSWGGKTFSYRPDALSFMYKREYAGEDKSEPCTFVAYLWKGSMSQADVPVTITGGGNAEKATMTNRDYNVLFGKDKATRTGGTITPSADFERIAVINETEAVEHTEWTSKMLEFKYESDATPSMINVIFAANNYFDAETDAVIGNSLSIDDVKLVYYSRLESVRLGEVTVKDFNPDVYSYNVTFENVNKLKDALNDVEAVFLSKAGTAKKSVSVEGNTVKITVTNDGEDVDGLKEHTYTFTCHYVHHTIEYPGTIDIYLGEDPAHLDGQKVYIDHLGTDGLVHFRLPNFSLGEDANLGDIEVNFVAYTDDDTKTYKGSRDKLSLDGTALGMDEILANVVLDATEDADGKLVANIDVVWLMPVTAAPAADGAADEPQYTEVPIKVVFNGTRGSVTAIDRIEADADADAPATYFRINGTRATEPLAPGLYIKRQGEKVSKIIVR